MNKIIEDLIEYGNSLKGAEVYFRDDWQCYYFSLLGKSFGLMSDKIITLKGEPVENIRLREKYSDITPGYYSNKIHWNSIILQTKQLTKEEIIDLIEKSYMLVYKKLKKKEKAIVSDM